MLHEFLSSNREELISRCRAKVAQRNAPRAAERELEFGIPIFPSQLIESLRRESFRSDSTPKSGYPRTGRDLATAGIGKAASSHGSSIAHEFQNRRNTAMLAFKLIKDGNVGVAGSSGTILDRSLKAHGSVFLKASSSADRVLIDVADMCGGLPPEDIEDLLRSFEQRGLDGSGLGIGLGISRRGVEANEGELRVLNVPGKGCIFTIDLPMAALAA